MSAGGFASWAPDLEAAFDEVARTALGADALAVAHRGGEPPNAWQGAYLGLVGPTGGIQIGIASDEPGCQALSKRLLGMDVAEPALTAAEVADAVCEIVNIVAGAFKARVRDRVSSLQMGLPVFFTGAVQASEHIMVTMAEVRLGEVPAAILLVHPRDGAGA